MLDSAGYVLPYNGEELILTKSRKSENQISYDQYSAFIQNTLEINEEHADYFVTPGSAPVYGTSTGPP